MYVISLQQQAKKGLNAHNEGKCKKKGERDKTKSQQWHMMSLVIQCTAAKKLHNNQNPEILMIHETLLCLSSKADQ